MQFKTTYLGLYGMEYLKEEVDLFKSGAKTKDQVELVFDEAATQIGSHIDHGAPFWDLYGEFVKGDAVKVKRVVSMASGLIVSYYCYFVSTVGSWTFHYII